MKMTYGTDIVTHYRPEDPEHLLRGHQKITLASGSVVLPNAFSTMLQKVCLSPTSNDAHIHTSLQGTRVREKEEISKSFSMQARELRALSSISSEVIVYRGRGQPKWVDVEPGQ